LYFDGTRVRANTDIDKQVPRFYYEVKQHLQTLFGTKADASALESTRGFTDTYSGQRLLSSRGRTPYARQGDSQVCPTDPDATILYAEYGHSRLGYNMHYVVDGGRARHTSQYPGQYPDAGFRTLGTFPLEATPVYCGGWRKIWLSSQPCWATKGWCPYLATADFTKRSKVYGLEDFRYDTEQNGYWCPQGHFLPLSSYDQYQEAFMYRTSAKICQACPVKTNCTNSNYARVVRRSIVQDFLDRAKPFRATPAYLKAMRKRSVWIEQLFGEAKQWHQLVQFRLRRLHKVNIQALLTAAGQNIKRLLKQQTFAPSLPPSHPTVLALSPTKRLSFLPLNAL
jgi:hypothetical protein